jgi:hypothetical protein
VSAPGSGAAAHMPVSACSRGTPSRAVTARASRIVAAEKRALSASLISPGVTSTSRQLRRGRHHHRAPSPGAPAGVSRTRTRVSPSTGTERRTGVARGSAQRGRRHGCPPARRRSRRGRPRREPARGRRDQDRPQEHRRVRALDHHSGGPVAPADAVARPAGPNGEDRPTDRSRLGDAAVRRAGAGGGTGSPGARSDRVGRIGVTVPDVECSPAACGTA